MVQQAVLIISAMHAFSMAAWICNHISKHGIHLFRLVSWARAMGTKKDVGTWRALHRGAAQNMHSTNEHRQIVGLKGMQVRKKKQLHAAAAAAHRDAPALPRTCTCGVYFLLRRSAHTGCAFGAKGQAAGWRCGATAAAGNRCPAARDSAPASGAGWDWRGGRSLQA